MKKTMLIIFLFTGISIFADGVQPVGSGTEADPYQVETLDNLLWISTNSSSWSSYFEQIADIDASSTTDWNSGAGFSPIGNGSPYFTGSYNGQDHTIDGLFINRYMHYVGLFGYTNDAEFDNIGLTNVDIAGNIDVGGLVGWNFYSPVSNCYTTGIVSGTGGQVGGLVGTNQYSPIINSYATCSVSGNGWSVGGLVGQNWASSTISKSYATGSVNGSNYRVGGLAGFNSENSSISNSYATGSVTGTTDVVGGLVGYNYYSTVSNCYATGSVNGTDDVGGLVGYNGADASISNSYANGSVTGTGGQVGGLVGLNYNSTEENSFWDTETSGQSSSIQGTGKTTAEMKNVRTYTDTAWSSGLDSPWDFVTNPYDDVGTDDHWNMDGLRTNDGYPFLNWQDVEVLPDAPANIIITMVGNDVELNWDAVTGATSYSIYSSDDPYAVDWGTAAATGIIGTSWSELIPDEKKFYYVTAVN